MNPKRPLAALVLILAAFPGWGADTVIDQLYGMRSYDLADAYWSAGQRFVDLGQADRGAEFKAKALKLYPGYVPGQAPAVTAPAAPQAAPVIPAASVVREQNLQGQKIARLQFQKLLRGYLTGSAATVSSVLADSLTVQGQTSTPSLESVKAFLQTHPAEAGAPDDLFLLDTLAVADGTGQKVLISVSPQPLSHLETLLPFWKPSQVYTFDRVGETWKLIAIDGNE